MTKKKTYRDVTEMVRDKSESPEFADSFSKYLGERQLVKQLVGLRAAKGISQSELARKIGCPQSRISKLEAGVDADIRLGDLLDYLAALNTTSQLVYHEGSATVPILKLISTDRELDRIPEKSKTVIADKKRRKPAVV